MRTAAFILAGLLLATGTVVRAQPGTKAPEAHDHAAHAHGEAHGQDHAHEPRRASPAANRSSWPLLLLGGYCVLIVGASLLGGWLPRWITLTHTRMQVTISFIGGLMLGIGVLHMLPHSLAELGPARVDLASGWIVAGLVSMFLLLRAFHFHQHGAAEVSSGETCPHDHDHDRGHGHQNPKHHDH